jgi:AraC-like DNA-binding protein
MSEAVTMDPLDPQQAEREAHRAQANKDELVERITQTVPKDGRSQPLVGLHLHRSSSPKKLHSRSEPTFCIVAQGSKEVFLGKECYRYDPANYLLITTELPLVGHIVEASKERPYLSLRLELDPTLVGSAMVEAGHLSSQDHVNVRAINVSTLDVSLLDAVVRLVRLIDTPGEAQVLAPLVMREIVYRLLMGNQGDRLRHIAALSGYTSPITTAIERLRENFDQPLRIDDIAREVGMSVSGFHHHFKAVTTMSPLQFQKQMRLQEARRLMFGEHLDAASAGSRVGYDDASHFNREYKRLFGEPPMRDIERLREAAGQNGDLDTNQELMS